jgi:hypothetical protein
MNQLIDTYSRGLCQKFYFGNNDLKRITLSLMFLLLPSISWATDFTTSIDGTLSFVSNLSNSPASNLAGNSNCAMTPGTHYYSKQTIRTNSAGSYTFAIGSEPIDGFFAFYNAYGFDPSNPHHNLITCNDDTAGYAPAITATLEAGTEYTLVYTTFRDNTTSGGGISTYSSTPDVTSIGGQTPTPPTPSTPSCSYGSDDTVSTTSDTPATTDDVLANDLLWGTGNTTSLTNARSLYGGTVGDNGDNTYSYTPASGFRGKDYFTYWIHNADCSSLGMVKVTVE